MNQNVKVKSTSTIIINSVISKIQIIIGAFLIFMFGGTFLYITIDKWKIMRSIQIAFAILTMVAIIIFLKGLKRSKLIRLFRCYSPILSADPIHSLGQLASSVGSSMDAVKKNVEEMIKRGFFINTYIDYSNNCVVFSNGETVNFTVNTQMKLEYSSVICKGCGASNKVLLGSVSECEYCGSLLKN